MLTKRQYEAAKMMATTDLYYKEIADKLNVSTRTVRWYAEKLYRDFGFNERIAVVQFWARNEFRLKDYLSYVRWFGSRSQ